MKSSPALGSILLIAGTCIGAGMLGLPVSLAHAGFGYALIVLFLMWVFMYYTGLLTLEVNLWMPPNTNFVTMAKRTLGRPGALITSVVYLLMLYSLMAAYLTGGGAIFASFYHDMSHGSISTGLGTVPWLILFVIVLYLGVRVVDGINRLLMFGLLACYALMVTFSVPHLKTTHFILGHSEYILAALPVIITSFGYHIIVPSVRAYLRNDAKKLRRIIFWGSFVPFIVYVIWIAIIFGVIPVAGSHSLMTLRSSGDASTAVASVLSFILGDSWLAIVARFFAFFALATSFLGVSFSLFDFLSDTLKIEKTHRGKLLLSSITFIPPLVFAFTYPQGFMMALGYAGIFVALLHGVLPALMIWSGRYVRDMAFGYMACGGKIILTGVILISALVIFAQLGANLGWIAV
tara:strand:+ start:5255 stop:6469 length:1215 start_codon:yes stop_codon:yes gene_type:complete